MKKYIIPESKLQSRSDQDTRNSYIVKVFFGVLAFVSLMILTLSYSCEKIHNDIPGPTGPTGITGSIGPTGPTGATGSGIRTGFHVIEFGDPTDTSAPNTGTVILNGVILWDTTTTVPTSFTVFIDGEQHPDDVIKVSGNGSKTSIGYYFQEIVGMD